MDKRILKIVDEWVRAMRTTKKFKRLPEGHKNKFAQEYSPFKPEVKEHVSKFLAWADERNIDPIWYLKALHRYKGFKWVPLDKLINQYFAARYRENSLAFYEAEQDRIETMEVLHDPTQINPVWETVKRIHQHNKIMCIISNTGGFHQDSPYCQECGEETRRNCREYLRRRNPEVYEARFKDFYLKWGA